MIFLLANGWIQFYHLSQESSTESWVTVIKFYQLHLLTSNFEGLAAHTSNISASSASAGQAH